MVVRRKDLEVVCSSLQVCKDRGFVCHDSWIAKCIQLHEMCQVRHGVMLIGPAGSGNRSLFYRANV